MRKQPAEKIESILRQLGRARLGKQRKHLIGQLRKKVSAHKKESADQAREIKRLERRLSDTIIERNNRFDEVFELKEKMAALNDLGDYLARASKGAIIVVTDHETKWKEGKKR